MPRKTDGIEFELKPGVRKGDDGKPLLYAQLAKGKVISFNQLEDFCEKHRHMEVGELTRLFTLLIDVAGHYLSEGYRVQTPIGSFALKLKLMGEHTDPKTVTGRDIKLDGVEFIPSKELKEAASQNRLGYRLSKEPVGNSQMYDPKAMEEALRNSLKLGYTSVSTFMYFSGLKRDSAQKYLDSLTKGEDASLLRIKIGKSYIYSPKKKSKSE